MKFIRALAVALLLGGVGIFVGCGESDDSAGATPPAADTDPEKEREKYMNSGRFGPGGQNQPEQGASDTGM